MRYPTSLQAIAAILLGALIALVIVAIDLVTTTARTIEQFPKQVLAAIEAEGKLVRATAAVESRSWRLMVDRQATAARKDVRGESKEWRQVSAEELRALRGEVIQMSNARLSDLIAKMDAPSDAAVRLLDEYTRVPAIVGARMDPWTDCKGNGACWQAQTTAFLGAARVTAGETSRTMRTIRETAPAIAANIDQTTANVARLTKPDSLGMKALKLIAPISGGALFGAIK